MIDDQFVIDAVIHSYNLDPSNYAVERDAQVITDMVYGVVAGSGPAYELSPEDYIRDWDIEETANTLFLESQTDIGIYHPTPIKAFHDGLISVEKAAEITKRWPNRFLTYATVDPLDGAKALDELDRQVELLNPIGVKFYPSSWNEKNRHQGWRMDDEKVAYPIYERIKQHGIKCVAIHKAVPLGPVPINSYKVDDIDGAAADHPDLLFEIVHGGVSFGEETAWLLARFPNVFINLEALNVVLAKRPRLFARAVLDMAMVVADGIFDRMFWGTGHMSFHARPSLEGLRDFAFPEDMLETTGQFAPVSQITAEHKRQILSTNYANALGLDLDELRAGVADDEFARRKATGGLAQPWSTSARLSPASAPVGVGR